MGEFTTMKPVNGTGWLGAIWCEWTHGQYHQHIGYGAYVCSLCLEALRLRREKAGVCHACGQQMPVKGD